MRPIALGYFQIPDRKYLLCAWHCSLYLHHNQRSLLIRLLSLVSWLGCSHLGASVGEFMQQVGSQCRGTIQRHSIKKYLRYWKVCSQLNWKRGLCLRSVIIMWGKKAAEKCNINRTKKYLQTILQPISDLQCIQISTHLAQLWLYVYKIYPQVHIRILLKWI